jgi:hypothetical protein
MQETRATHVNQVNTVTLRKLQALRVDVRIARQVDTKTWQDSVRTTQIADAKLVKRASTVQILKQTPQQRVKIAMLEDIAQKRR